MTTPAAEQLDEVETFRRLHKAAGLVLSGQLANDPTAQVEQVISIMCGMTIEQVRALDPERFGLAAAKMLGLVAAELVRLGVIAPMEAARWAGLAPQPGTPLN